MKIVQFFIFVILVICIVFTVVPVYEINIGNTTISWDGISEKSKHFSIEIFNTETGEIKDAFIMSKNKHDEGYTIDIEGWHNIDEKYFVMQFG